MTPIKENLKKSRFSLIALLVSLTFTAAAFASTYVWDIEDGYIFSIFMASGVMLLLIAYIIDKEYIINSRLPFIQSCNNKVPKLSSTGGIGTQFVESDNLRRYKEDGTQYKVRYAFFEFFGLPIFPLGCFATEQTFFNMRYKTTTTYYTIYGKQKQYACELAYIYLRGWGIGIFIIGIIFSLINFSAN